MTTAPTSSFAWAGGCTESPSEEHHGHLNETDTPALAEAWGIGVVVLALAYLLAFPAEATHAA
jgi:hypothetical protein